MVTLRAVLAAAKKKTLYTLMEKKDTGEFHLFVSHKNDKMECIPGPASVCDGMKQGERGVVKFACKEEDEARLACATVGKMVCGSCVSHLYLTPK